MLILAFLKRFLFFLKSDNHSETKVAWRDPVDQNAGKTLELICSEEDFQAYIKEKVFTLRLNAVTDELLTQDHHFKIRSTYAVKAQPIN